jgi:hypothetical protein
MKKLWVYWDGTFYDFLTKWSAYVLISAVFGMGIQYGSSLPRMEITTARP